MKKIITSFVIAFLCFAFSANANYMLVQNVSTTGNDAVNKTIQVQFDISWDNSWRDEINWDAAWIFIKFKDASGNWQHAKLNTSGYVNGSGTSNAIQVTSDNVGAWMYRSTLDTGKFNVTSAQLQWNYGASGLTNVTGLEVRVFAVEMVYIPQGDFVLNGSHFGISSFGQQYPPMGQWQNFAVINTRMTPTIKPFKVSGSEFRIKGNSGIDSDNDGIIDITEYPTGYYPFYCYKYQLTEQQFSDFYNTLTSAQKTTLVTDLGIAGDSIFLSNGEYFSSSPNKSKVCRNSTSSLAYADWSGLRPMTILEYSKACVGPFVHMYEYMGDNVFYPIPGFDPNSPSSPFKYSYYGVTKLELDEDQDRAFYVTNSNFNYIPNNGNGELNIDGSHNVAGWGWVGSAWDNWKYLRYVRSAE